MRMLWLGPMLLAVCCVFYFCALSDATDPPASTPGQGGSSHATIRILAAPPSVLNDRQVFNPNEYSLYKNTQAQLLKSNFVLVRTSRKLEAMNLPTILAQKERGVVRWLGENLVVTAPENSELLTISVANCPPDDATKIVNALADVYLDEVVNAEHKEQLARRDTLERTVSKHRAELRRKLQEFHSLAKSLGPDASFRKELARRDLDYLLDRRHRMQERVDDLGLRLDILRELAKKAEPAAPKAEDAPAAAPANAATEIANLEAERTACEKQLADAASRLNESAEGLAKLLNSQNSSDLKSLKGELEELTEITAQMAKKLAVLNLELESPLRIQLIERASAH